MKRILDPAFRYRPSYDTDVRRTFEAVRRQQAGRCERRDEDGARDAGEEHPAVPARGMLATEQ